MSSSVEASQNKYEGIENTSLREQLTFFDGLCDSNFKGDSITLLYFPDPPFCVALGLKPKKMKQLVSDTLQKEIIRYPIIETESGKEVSRELDKPRCVAFAAIAWVLDQKYKRKKGNLIDLPKKREDLPWREVVYDTKEALGSHPLSDLIHTPASKQVVDVVQSEVYSPTVAKEKEIIGIRSKFPRLKVEELNKLNEIYLESDPEGELDSIQHHINMLPKGQIEDVDPIKHDAPDYIVQTVMFIFWANRKELEKYNPEQEEYSVVAYHKALLVAWRYLRDFKKVKSLGQLLTLIKTAVGKDPEAFWKQTKSSL